MAARKRRKSAGLTGFIADAISEQRKAAETTRRLETRAEAAWANMTAKVEAAEAKEKIKQEARATREREVEAGHA